MNTKRINYLEGLRGLSAIIVVIHHFTAAFLPATYLGIENLAVSDIELLIYKTPISLFLNGNSAVCIFFVLSAYLVVQKQYASPKEGPVEYIGKRYLRFTLPILCAVLIAFVFMQNNLFMNQQASEITKSNWLSRQWQATPDIFTALQSGTYRALISFDREYISILWTMHIIFIGSIGTYLTVYYAQRRTIRWIIYIFGFFIFFKSYFLAMVLGAIISELHAANIKIINKKIASILLGIALALLSYPITASETGVHPYLKLPFSESVGNIIVFHIVGAALLIYLLPTLESVQKLLSKRLLIFFGRISFSLYLVHMLILGSLSCIVFLWINDKTAYSLNIAVILGISLPIVVISAYLFSQTIEKWSERLIKSIIAYIYLHKH